MNMWREVITSVNGVQLLKWGNRYRVQWALVGRAADMMEFDSLHAASLEYERRCLEVGRCRK